MLEVDLVGLGAPDEDPFRHPSLDNLNGAVEHDLRRSRLTADVSPASGKAINEDKLLVPPRAAAPAATQNRQPRAEIPMQDLMLRSRVLRVHPLLIGVVW